MSGGPPPAQQATTNLPPDVLRAIANAGAPAFAPPGIAGLGSPALSPRQPVPPVGPASGGAPGGSGDTTAAESLQALVPTEDVEQGPNADEEDDRELDDLGYGDRPLQGPAGHSQTSFRHPLDRAADTIRSELQETTTRLAGALFPEGPAGSNQLSHKAMLDFVGRHWEDPQFRQTLLDRVAPKGPDGNRLPSGVKLFHKLYQDAIVKTGKHRPAQPPEPPAGPAGPGLAAPAPAPPAAPVAPAMAAGAGAGGMSAPPVPPGPPQ